MIDWAAIDTVLLDMDGTLLDLHFDNYFWLEHLPEYYAQQRGLSTAAAHKELHARYAAMRGTLDWYCIDYWSQQLGLDIEEQKRRLRHLIGLRPSAELFLKALASSGKTVALVTNAHMKSLRIKLQQTGIERYFDRLICSHELGLPKETPEFWERLQATQTFEPTRTLLIDDNEAVLESAQTYGIRHLYSIETPDLQQGPRAGETQFVRISDFQALLPIVPLTDTPS